MPPTPRKPLDNKTDKTDSVVAPEVSQDDVHRSDSPDVEQENAVEENGDDSFAPRVDAKGVTVEDLNK